MPLRMPIPKRLPTLEHVDAMGVGLRIRSETQNALRERVAGIAYPAARRTDGECATVARP